MLKQMAVALDEHYQAWADLHIKAVKEGAELPPQPDINQLIMMAKQIVGGQ